eukprot:g2671.t1
MVKSIADSIVEQGMDKLGYKYVCLDDCWSATTRNATGHLQAEADAFPSGMKALADYVHAKNLSLGLYTCVGTKTCKGDRPGSYGYYEQDAKTLAEWGVDLVKMDHCAAPKNTTDKDLYGQMSAALNATGRPIVFSLCQWGQQEVWQWGAEVAQMYRIQMDHLPFWNFPPGSEGVGFGEGTKNIIEWMASLQPSKWTKQYGWLDPDFLMTLYTPTMDFTASRTEMTFWSVWSSPLLVSTDVRAMSDEKKSILMNPEVIAVNQDPSYTAADRLRNDSSTGEQLWARDLANGDKVVVLYNSGDGSGKDSNITIHVTWAEIGWANTTSSTEDQEAISTNVHVRDLWARADKGAFADGYSAPVAPRDVKLLRLSRSSERKL